VPDDCGIIVRFFVDGSSVNTAVESLSLAGWGDIDALSPYNNDVGIPTLHNYKRQDDSIGTVLCVGTPSAAPMTGAWRQTRLYRVNNPGATNETSNLLHRLTTFRLPDGTTSAWEWSGSSLPNAVPFDTVIESYVELPCSSSVPVEFRVDTVGGVIDGTTQTCNFTPSEIDLNPASSTSGGIKINFHDRVAFASSYGAVSGSANYSVAADLVQDGVVNLVDWRAFDSCYKALRTGCLADVAGANQGVEPDGYLTADDIIVYLSRYFAGSIAADLSGPNQAPLVDGVLTADDIIVFLGAFFAPCP